MIKVFYEAAGKEPILLLETDDFNEAERVGTIAYNNAKSLRVWLKCVVCVKIYDDNRANFIQYGPI